MLCKYNEIHFYSGTAKAVVKEYSGDFIACILANTPKGEKLLDQFELSAKDGLPTKQAMEKLTSLVNSLNS